MSKNTDYYRRIYILKNLELNGINISLNFVIAAAQTMDFQALNENRCIVVDMSKSHEIEKESRTFM